MTTIASAIIQQWCCTTCSIEQIAKDHHVTARCVVKILREHGYSR